MSEDQQPEIVLQYDWEKDVIEILKAIMLTVNENDNYWQSEFHVIGLAIGNSETGEGAFIPIVENDGSMLLKDVMQDVASDACRFYDETLQKRMN